MRTPSVLRDPEGMKAFQVKPRGVEQAISRAIRYEDREFAQTRWSDVVSAGGRPRVWGGQRFGNRLIDQRAMRIARPIEQVFAPIQRIGGDTGCMTEIFCGSGAAGWTWAWAALACAADGGIRHSLRLAKRSISGESKRDQPPRRLRLSAEMKLPGRAWLEFEPLRTGTLRKSARRRSLIRWTFWSRVLVSLISGTSVGVCGDVAADC